MSKGFKQSVKIFSVIGIYLLSNQQIKAQSPRTVPANYPAGTKVNFVRTWDATAPVQDPNAIMSKPLSDVKQTTQYFDGLGRPLQTVMKQGSMVTGAAATDMVSPVEYDAFGREQFKYLPYAEPSVNDGTFKSNPFAQQAAFYNNPGGILKGQNETFFYNKTNFEASPLNRVTDTYAPGNSWVGSESNAESQRRNVQIKYGINTPTDVVRIWNVTDNVTMGQFGSYTTTATYPAGELYKTITTDEHKKQVIEFKDKEGKVILKKVQLTAVPDDGTGSDYTGWLSTYYIYDDLGNLRCVIQPEGVKALIPGWSFSSIPVLLNEQCFRYEYDQRNRMIVKKVPGAGEVYMVYDDWDRLVLTQDASQRVNSQYMLTKYDALNRPVITGIYTYYGTIQQARDLAKNYAPYRYEELQGSAASGTGYTSRCWPESNYDVLTVSYYDKYDWATGTPLSANRYTGDDSQFLTPSNDNYPYAQPLTQSFLTTGMVTGGKVKVLGSSQYLFSALYYDDKGRVIQAYSLNITGGSNISTKQYSFSGQVLRSYDLTVNNTLNHAIGTLSKYNYDALGRLSDVKKMVLTSFGVGAAEKTIVQNEYNALGQLKKKKLAPEYKSGAGLETVAYDYNIRGWLLGANRDYAKDAAGSDNYFGFDLGYDKVNNNIVGGQTYSTPQYNGNIEGMVWKSKGDGEKRKYDFGYDAANRLMRADFTQYTGGTFNQSAGVNFSMLVGNGVDYGSAYDDNGNIKTMYEMGLKLNASVPVDDLEYKYEANSNRLKYVFDHVYSVGTKLGDFSEPTANYNDNTINQIADYSYDVNGNLNLDKNKAISSITYNHLNLPAVITVTGKGTISYTYDAAGNKLKKTTVDNTVVPTKTTVTDYIGGLVYENNVLQFMGQEEGRIRYKSAIGTIPASFQYDYMLKDHLGNVRMVLTEEEQQDKYPIASLEDSKVATEQTYYDINTSFIRKTDLNPIGGLANYINNYNGIGNNPADAAFEGTNSKNLYRINGNENKTGLGITLKVMAGDKVNIFGNSYYGSAVVNNGTCSGCALSITNLVTAFLNAPSAAASTAAHGAVGPTLVESQAGSGINGGLLNSQNSQALSNTTRPRAFINYILFDEQFKYAGGGTSIVGAAGELKKHQNDPQLQNIAVPKNGYIYVYCSNESNIDVFFDNLQVVHTRGAILEETHYYPFGLTMAGISSKAAGGIENKKLFNDGTELQSKEFSDGSGLEIYETPYRSYDAQLGRFHQIDPLAFLTSDFSPYAFALNNPVLRNDPTGLKDTVWKPIPDVVVVSQPKKLKGGNFDGQSFQSIELIRGLMGNQTKRIINNYSITNKDFGQFFKEIEDLKKAAELLKLSDKAGAVTGSLSELAKALKYLKSGKGSLSTTVVVATMLYLEGVKKGISADELQNVVMTYISIHSADPENQKGLYEITTTVTYPSAATPSGSQTVITYDYYDVSSKKYVGSAKIY